MSRKGRNKPFDPAEQSRIQARRAERRELEARGIVVNTDARSEEITGRWRPTCFQMLLKQNHQREAQAVDWLEDLIRTASGENAMERRPDFIRASVEGAPGQNVSQSMIDASRVLSVVKAGLRPWEWLLLTDLLKPDAALLTRWRDAVERITKEVNPQAQGSRVRAACEALLFVKEEIERRPRMAA